MATPPGTPPSTPADPSKVENQENYIELLLKSAKEQEKLNKLERERAELLNKSSEALTKQLDTQNSILNVLIGSVPALDDLKMMDDELLRLKKESVKVTKEHQEQLNMMAKAIRENADGMTEEAALLEAQLELEQQLVDEQTKKIKAQEESIKQIKDQHTSMMDMLETSEELKGLKDIVLDNGKTVLENLKKENLQEKDIRDILLEAKAINTDMVKLQGKLTRHSEKFAGALGLARDASDTSLGTFMDTAKQLSQMSASGFSMSEALGSAFGQSFNMLNVFASLVDIIKDMVIQLDQVGKKLGASTGMGNVFQSQIMTTFDATVRGGGTMEESANAIGSLATGFSKFNPEAEKVNSSLATTVVRLGKLGISGDQAAKTMDFFVRTLRMTEQQSSDLTVELALMGQQMGLTSSQIISDFQAVSSDLAIYGNNAIEVFRDLEAQAKATGMEINSLVNMAKQFDQFDSAAQKVAELNAVLGTQMSAIELMNMSYDERVNLIRQEVSFAAGNMENLDQYTQQFIAQALGVGSVAEAQKMLNMSQAEYLGYQSDMAEANKSQEELAKLTQELVPVMQQLKIAFMKIATSLAPVIVALTYLFLAAEPIVTILISIVEVAALVAVGYGLMAAASAAVGAAYVVFQIGLTATRLQMLLFVKGAVTATVAGFMSLTSGVTLFGIAINATALRFTIFIGLFYGLLKVLGVKFNPVLVAAFHFMAVGVTMLGAAFNTLQGPAMLAMLVFSLMVGVLALFVYSLKELIVTLVDSGAGLFTAASGMYAIAGGIGAIAMAMIALGPAGFMGLIVLASAMYTMGVGFEKTASGIERISKMSTALSNLGNNGMIAISAEGNKINALMGAGDVFQNFSGGKIEVEVKMPDQQQPKIDLTVELMGRQLETFVKKIVGGGG